MTKHGLKSLGRAPRFTLKSVSGKPISLESYKGKVILVDFWATWCPPCIKGIPHFINLQKKYEKQGLQVLGISVDSSVNPVLPFISKYKINYPIMMERPDVIQAFGEIRAVPTTFIIDRNLNIVDKVVGYRSEEYFEQIVKMLL